MLLPLFIDPNFLLIEGQIWVSDGNDSLQFTNFPIDSYVLGFDWAADHKKDALDSSQIRFPFVSPVRFQLWWDDLAEANLENLGTHLITLITSAILVRRML